MDINNGYDRHLDPPDDEIEGQDCEFCNESMEYRDYGDGDCGFVCKNQFCPEKFDIKCGTTVIGMANRLVEVEQELLDLKLKLKQAKNLEDYHANQVRELTQSQPVVRDTNWAIKAMEDAIEFVDGSSTWQEYYENMPALRKEWKEVKKILEQGNG
jgi:hypothetical protein